MIEIYINNERLEIPDQNIVQTFQLNDVGNLSDRQTSYTNKIKVPKTPKNVKIASNIDLVGSVYETPGALNFPYGKPNVKIINEGIELVTNGFAVMIDSDSLNYYIAIYGSEKTFFEEMKKYTLKDVFPTDIILYISSSNMASFVHSEDVYSFPIVNYYTDTFGMNYALATRVSPPPPTPYANLNTKKMAPHFFVKDLIDYIFDYLGYTVDHDLSTNDDFINLLLAPLKGVANSSSYYYGEFNLNLHNYLPEININEFVSEIMYRFGLVLKVDEVSKTVYLKNIDDIIADTPTDWSDKFSHVKKKKYILTGYAQNNYFKYTEDKTNEMTGTLETGNLNLASEKTIINSTFNKPTDAEGSESGDHAYGILYVPTTGDVLEFPLLDFTDFGTVWITTSFEKQLVYRYRVDEDFYYNLNNPDGNVASLKSYFFVGTRDDISFQHYVDTYYTKFSDLLKSMEKVFAFINLSVIDIHNLDLLKPIYVKQLGSSFYINKIINFKQGRLTEVELIKIP